METRRRKRQQEVEAAEASAPVETRKQKAARLAQQTSPLGLANSSLNLSSNPKDSAKAHKKNSLAKGKAHNKAGNKATQDNPAKAVQKATKAAPTPKPKLCETQTKKGLAPTEEVNRPQDLAQRLCKKNLPPEVGIKTCGIKRKKAEEPVLGGNLLANRESRNSRAKKARSKKEPGKEILIKGGGSLKGEVEADTLKGPALGKEDKDQLQGGALSEEAEPEGLELFSEIVVKKGNKAGSKEDTANLEVLQAKNPLQNGSMDRRNREALKRHLAEGFGDEEDLLDSEFGKNASALHGLLRKLGGESGTLHDIFSQGMASTSRFKSILVLLKGEDTESQLDGLHQLNDLLSVAMEDTLSLSPSDQLVPLLVSLLQESEVADILLLSARGLTYLADVMPASCHSIVRHRAVPVLCERLLNIEYIDVAEQSLTALSKLANEHAHACVRDGALIACLSYLDFFEASVQRLAVSTAAQMCRGLAMEHIEAINSAVPILTNLLQYQDAKVVESASLALTRIAETLQHSPQHLSTLCNQGLIANTLQLVSVSDNGSMTSPLAVNTYFGLIKLLTACVTGSGSVAETLHQAGVSKTINKLLSSSPLFSLPTSSSSAVLRTSEQLKEVISLTHALLPPLTESSTFMSEDIPTVADLDKDGPNEADPDVVQRRQFLADNLTLLENFDEDVLALLLDVYKGTMVHQAKSKCLQTVVKVLQYTPASSLKTILQNVPISSFTASLLSGQEGTVLSIALRIAELLQIKLPDVFSTMLLKEGVVHAIDTLALEAPSAPSASLEKQKQKRASSRLKSKAGKKLGSSPDDPAPIQAPPSKPPTSVSLRQSCAVRAQQFISKYHAGSGGLSLETDGVRLLRDLCKDLDKPDAIGSILKALREKDGGEVSTFEFLKSGTVQELRKYLLGEDIGSEDRTEKLLSRLEKFCEVAMNQNSTSGLQALIRKLQEGLAAEENFPVSTSQVVVSSRYGASLHSGRTMSAEASQLTQGIAALSQPFRLNLARAPHEKELSDYGSNTVLIEPLATMAAVEDFLYPKLRHTNSSNKDNLETAAILDTILTGAQAGKDDSRIKQENGQSAAPDNLRWETSGERQSRKPASKVQPIPGQAPTDNSNSGPNTRSRFTQAASLVRKALSPKAIDAAISVEEAFKVPADEATELDAEEDYSDEDDEGDEDMADDMDEEEGIGVDRLHIHTVNLDNEAEENGVDEGNPDTGDVRPAAAAELNSSAEQTGAKSALTSALQDRGARSYAQATAGQNNGPGESEGRTHHRTNPTNCRLRFYVNNKACPSSYTIFQAVNDLARAQRSELQANESAGQYGRRRRLWEDTHTIHYSRIENPMPDLGTNKDEGSTDPDVSTTLPFKELLHVSLPEDLNVSLQVEDVLILLKLLEALNRLCGQLSRRQDGLIGKSNTTPHLFPIIPRDDFISHKLTPKLAQQLKDVLALCGGNIPAWMQDMIGPFKFLFPFELRRRYFYCTASGIGRALNYLQNAQAAENSNTLQEQRAGRVPRSKVRISRRRLMESAVKVMDMYAGSQSNLELEFFNEVGTGLGPTLEFYTILSHELQKKGMGLWRGDHGEEIVAATGNMEATKNAEDGVVQLGPALPDKHVAKRQLYIQAPQGLFPSPLHLSKLSSSEKIVANFTLLGQSVGKALQDNRLLDIPLSHTFYRAVLGQQLDLYNVRDIDTSLGISLEKFVAAHKAWTSSDKLQPLLIDGVSVQDLCLTFELPGYPEYELKSNGASIDVTSDNILEYVDAIVDATLGKGIHAQMQAFRDGFSQVMALDSLQCFYADELEAVLCGQGESWSPELLIDAIKFDHGYTANSTAIKFFVEILSELDAADQRRFLRFITGSPRLRPGGLGALHPRMTVVRKHPSSSTQDVQPGSSVELLARSGSIVDGDLPSVMTCANYIKLPPYSSKKIMHARILYAIREGQGSFDLS